MTTIDTTRAANDNVPTASLLAVARWNEARAAKERRPFNKARYTEQATELRAVVAQMKEVA